MNPEKLLEDDWEKIKSYLEITEEDKHIFEEVTGILTPHQEEIMDAFYEYVLSFPQTRSFFRDKETVARVKARQLDYFKKLTMGEYDLEYLKDRTRVGVAHDRIGLQLRWYVGAYRKYMELILQRFCREYDGGILPYLNGIMKVVFLDMIVAIESYVGKREHRIRESEEHFRSIFEATNDAIFLFSPDYKILDANPEALKMLGLSREEVAGKKCYQLVHGSPTKCNEVPCTVDQVLNGEEVRGHVHQHTDCSGRKITVEISASSIRDEEGRVIAIVEAARDVTSRERVQKELERRIAELERWRRVTVDRELRMAELKEENRRLRQELERLRKLCSEGEE